MHLVPDYVYGLEDVRSAGKVTDDCQMTGLLRNFRSLQDGARYCNFLTCVKVAVILVE